MHASRFTRRALRGFGAVLLIGAIAVGAAACGDDDSPATATNGPAPSEVVSTATSAASSPSAAAKTPAADVTLTVYTGQHESLVQDLGNAFTKDTGIKLEIRSGSDADMANQIVEEGSRTKADLFLSEEPGPMGMLDKAGLLAPVDKASLAQVDERFVPESGDWLPYGARSRVIVYNPTIIAEDQLPNSIMDLANAEWKGKFAYAPSGAFTGTVAYLINTIGQDATLTWLKAIKENGVNEGSNGKIRDAVEAGQIGFGITNHYYWWILAQQKGGPDKLTSKLHYFDHPDAGSLVFASGAGVLKASQHQAEAQEFLKWLGSADGGQAIIAADASAQYPTGVGVSSKAGLDPIANLKSPTFDQGSLSNTDAAKDLIIQAGIS